jgi:hypothetical protein
MKDRLTHFAVRLVISGILTLAAVAAFGQVGPAWSWTRSSNDAANDGGSGIKVDAGGNVFAVGTANAVNPNTNPVPYGVVTKLGPDGSQKWVSALTDPSGLSLGLDALDGLGNVFVSGATATDLLTAKYDGNGNLLWKKTYTSISAGFRVVGECFASDGSGGVYVAAMSFPAQFTSSNWVICHYDASGNLKFSNETVVGSVFRMAVDSLGNVVLVGTTRNASNLQECTVWKLDANGNTVFQTIAGQGAGANVLVDSSNNIYTAYITNSISSLVEYNPTGTQLLSPQALDGPSEILDMHFDSQGNIVASGYYNRNAGGGIPSFGVWKLTNTGQKIWRQTWDYPVQNSLNPSPSGVFCAVDSADNVYVMSTYAYDNNDLLLLYPRNVALLKIDSSGNKLWPDSGGPFSLGALVIPNYFLWEMIPKGSAGLLLGGDTENLDFNGRMQVVDLETTQVSGLTISPNPQWSNVPTTGTVTLSSPAPVGGTVVGLSGSANVTVPPTVTVLEGQTSAQFPVKGINLTYAITTGTVTATLGSSSKPANFSIKPPDFAAFVSQFIPTSMIVGHSYPISLTYTNKGALTWTTAQGYKLQSRGPTDNVVFGINRLPLSNSPVANSQDAVFSGTVTAPATPGVYPMSWVPIEEGVTAFGSVSPVVNVNVVATGTDAASLGTLVAPSTIDAGHDFNASVSFVNTGSNTWSAAAGYRVVSVSPLLNSTWGPATMALTATAFPGSQANFIGRFNAPTTPGDYAFIWSLEHGSTIFGPVAGKTIHVVQGAYNAKFIGENVPTWVGPGTSFSAALVFQNTGTSAWGVPGATVGIKSENPAANMNWGTSFVLISGSTAPGANAVISHLFTAPATPGVYQFEWRITFQGGISFGDYSRPIAITVANDASRYISRTGATSVPAGSNFTVTYTMRNTGTTTWTVAAGYELISQAPLNNSIWGLNHVLVPTSVAPGAQVVISVPCKAPTTVGSHPMQFQMAKNGVPFGEKSAYVSVTVLATP